MAIKFRNKEHENRFYEIVVKMNNGDVYHTSVAYLLALDNECYRHIDSLFDFEEHLIKPYGAGLPLLRGVRAALLGKRRKHPVCALNQAWQTGTSAKTTRLMFNLWCGGCEDYDREKAAVKDSSRKYTVDEIFSSSLAIWYFEAIKLRYPNIGEVQ